jgi:ABC-type nickel/cobalt efflux system permease component RcnA
MLSTYFGVILIGLLHGLEPGHGWPVAAMYSLRKEKKFSFALLSSMIISFFHFVSSIAVVLIFILVNKQFNLSSSPIIRILGAILLFYLVYRLWNEKEQDTEAKKKVKNLKEIATFAFILGFAHEEEFALLAFCLNNVNCLLLMTSYALAVTVSIVTVTLLAVYAYEKIKPKVERFEPYLPKISAIILFVFVILYLIKAL